MIQSKYLCSKHSISHEVIQDKQDSEYMIQKENDSENDDFIFRKKLFHDSRNDFMIQKENKIQNTCLREKHSISREVFKLWS